MFFLASDRNKSLRKLTTSVAIFVVFLQLSGCALTIQNQPVNLPIQSKAEQGLSPSVNAVRNIVGENLIGFSFSGGGMRAAAFSFGALKAIESLEKQQPGILDDITFITSVSGGSLTAAFYGLNGKASLSQFREKVLLKDAEADMRLSPARPENFLRLLRGGLNDRDNMANWLDKNIFHGATFEDIYKRKKPDIWINATDVYNRTPFLFIPPVFNAICSDINKFSVAEAVHASMAVPLVFAPVLLKTYPEACVNAGAPWIDNVLANPEATSTVKAMARALKNYRNPSVMKYVKLVDGGVTDNFGPFTTQDVLRLKRMVFLVVDAGRGPSGDWVLDKAGPSGFDMALAATDTAIDAAARSSYDGFRLMMTQWQQNIVDFRCSLSRDGLQKFEVELSTWNCKDVKFFVGSVNFTDLEVQRAAKLDAIPTRLSLPQQEIDAAIEAGKDATINNAAFKSFLVERIQGK